MAVASAAVLAGVGWLGVRAEEERVPTAPTAVADADAIASAGPPAHSAADDVAPSAVGGPRLAAAPARAPRDPKDVRGTGAFVGRVRRDGRPLAATLELRRVGDVSPEAIADGSDPLDRHAWFRALGARPRRADHALGRGGDTRSIACVRACTRCACSTRAILPQAFPLVLLHDRERRETLLELPDGPASLTVEVRLADGGPAAASVAVASGSGWAWVRGDLPRRTDAQGRVRFDALPEGDATIFAWVDGEPAPREARVVLPTSGTLAIAPGAPARARAPGRVTGRVLDAATRAPVAGVRVHATQARATPDPWTYPLRSAPTDAGGSFVVEGLGAGFVTVFVQGGGYLSVGLETIRDDAPDPLARRTDETGRLEVEVLVTGVPPVVGQVVDEQGKPVAGATVRLEDLSRSAGAFTGLGKPPEIGLLNAAVVSISDEDGRFALSAPIPGHAYTVSASAPGRRMASTGLLRGAHDTETPVRLTLPLEEGDAWSEVVVREAASKTPVPFAIVHVWRGSGSGSYQGVAEFRAGRDGRVRAGPFRSLEGLRASTELPPGPPAGVSQSVDPVPLLETGTTIERPSPLRRLTVVVQAPPGEDAQKVDLYVSGPGIETSLLVRGATGPDGLYEIGVPGRGPFHLYGVLAANDRIEGRAMGTADAGMVRLVLEAAAPK